MPHANPRVMLATKASARSKWQAKWDAQSLKQADKKTDYTVTFRVPHRIKYGKIMCIVGSIMELGKWEEHSIGKMKCLDGVWVTDVRIPRHKGCFMYKYLIL